MSEPTVDLSYQAKTGPAFVLPKLAGGTGRTDGGSPMTVLAVVNESGGSLAAGTVVKKDNTYPTGPAMMVTPVTAATDVVAGVILAAIADGASGPMAMLGGVIPILTTGTITDGQFLVPSTTSGRAKGWTGALNEIAFAISLNATSGTSQVYAALFGLFVPGVTFSQFRSSVSLLIGDGANVITTGEKGHIRWPFAGVLQRATVMADVSGSIVLDVWKDTWANFPPTNADSICASAKPTLSSAQKSEDSTLTGWTKTFAEGDVYAFEVESASVVKRVTLDLKYERT